MIPVTAEATRPLLATFLSVAGLLLATADASVAATIPARATWVEACPRLVIGGGISKGGADYFDIKVDGMSCRRARQLLREEWEEGYWWLHPSKGLTTWRCSPKHGRLRDGSFFTRRTCTKRGVRLYYSEWG